MAYPAGMSTITVVGHVDRPDGKYASGYVWAEAERKFGYVGTSWLMIRTTAKKATTRGDFSITLPHSDQPGLIGDGGVPVTNIGWRIYFQPTNDTLIQTLAWQTLPMSLGSTVNINALGPNLGGWPNAAPVVVVPGGGATGALTATETYPGSGLFQVRVTV
jgi:hypothetical protein